MSTEKPAQADLHSIIVQDTCSSDYIKHFPMIFGAFYIASNIIVLGAKFFAYAFRMARTPEKMTCPQGLLTRPNIDA